MDAEEYNKEELSSDYNCEEHKTLASKCGCLRSWLDNHCDKCKRLLIDYCGIPICTHCTIEAMKKKRDLGIGLNED